jgi:hypothetical protein
MKRLTLTQRVLLIALAAALTGLGYDRLVGTGRTRTAQAENQATPPTADTPDWPTIDRIIWRLTHGDYQPLGDQLTRLRRDLFVPTDGMLHALTDQASSTKDIEVAAADDSDPARAPEPTFADRHRLLGITLGARPLAVVDGRLVPRGATVDGHQLVEIRRSHVVFRDPVTKESIRLELEVGPDNR